MVKFLKKTAVEFIRSRGYDLIKKEKEIKIGSQYRPVGNIHLFLEDLKARGLQCKTILDVGGNDTDWSRMAKKVYPEANCFLIEPQIEMKEKLEQFCKDFPGSVYFLVGAGSKKDVLTFTVDADLVGSSFLPKPDESLNQRKVEIVTIDDLLTDAKIPYPELIKLDIQGFELEALKGATKTFGYAEVYLLEVSLFSFNDVPGMPVLSEVISFMLERGYVVYDFPGFLRRPLDGALGQCDVCFVKKDGFLRSSNDWQ